MDLKPLDNEFLELYNRYETGVECSLTGEDAGVCCRNVLHKAGLDRRKQRTVRWVLPMAAVLAAAGMLAAAAYYRASDAFRGVLEVQPSAAVAGDSAVDAAPVLDRAGLVLDAAVTSGSVSISLRAAAGDEQHIKLLLDIEDRSGSPLAILQPDGSLSQDLLYLEEYLLMGENGEWLSYGARFDFIDPDPSDHRASLLLSYTLSDSVARGQSFRLRIADIMQFATLEGTSLEMGPDDLYTLVSGFEPVGEDGYRVANYSDEHGYGYMLTQNSGKSVDLSTGSSLRVTNAAVRGGTLHLRGTAGDRGELDRVMANAVLVNESTGERIPIDAGGLDDEGRWDAEFRGVDSLEELKGFVWYYGEGYGGHLLAEGEWEFAFALDVEDTTISVQPAAGTNWEGYALRVDRVELSPFSLRLEYSVDPGLVDEMVPPSEWGVYREPSAWESADKTVTLTMRDGTVVEVLGGGLSGRTVSQGQVTTDFALSYVLDVVIEPQQVASLTVGSLTIPLEGAQG